jgi:LPPG:FO 2-phospho-L-lactate transferase
VLAGGTGSAKLVRGLSKSTTENITVIVNIGDNILLHGLYVCPDIDTILYALSGILDKERGWGIKDDTFYFLDQIGKYGAENWFKLGDKDLSMHIMRTKMMNNEIPLSKITRILREKLMINQEIIPASDQHMETRIITTTENMHLQEFWVKHKGEPEVLDVKYQGIENSLPAPGVIKAINDSRKVILCPGNPVTSIAPITSIHLIKEALKNVKEKVLAVSPILGINPVSGPAGKLMKSMGFEVSPIGVAELYSSFIGKLIIDKCDKSLIERIEKIGMEAYTANILMNDEKDEHSLARYITGL